MMDLDRIFAAVPTLDTERCTLRELSTDDAPALFEMWRDERVTRFTESQPMPSAEHAVERINRMRRFFEERKAVPWAIIERQSGQVIGTCVYWNFVVAEDRVEIGYELAPRWWGQGLMVEALGAMLDYGFGTMALKEVEAHVNPENAASRRVLEKLGFQWAGVVIQAAAEPDDEATEWDVYALSGAAWRQPTHE